MTKISSKFGRYMLAGTALLAAAMPMTAARADDKDDGSTTVQVSAEARKMVQQDRVTATLAIEASGSSAAAPQMEINTKMQAAKKLYDTLQGYKITTGQYNVYKDYQPEPPVVKGSKPLTPEEREKLAIWRGSQELVIDGAKTDDLLKLIGELQKQGFAMRGLNFYMSREASDAVKDQLIVEALQNIKARSENIRQALGMKTVRYARLDLNDNGGVRPMPMMMKAARAEAFDASAAAPVAPVGEAGETEVVVNVTAEVKLK